MTNTPAREPLPKTYDPSAVEDLVRLADLLAIPVSEGGNSSRLNFPTTHPLHGPGPAANEADVVRVFEDVGPDMPD